MARLDHLVLMAPSLDIGVTGFEALTGVTAEFGGKHSVNGTANALASLGDGVYLEIMCPDPDGPAADSLGAKIAGLDHMLFTGFLVNCDDIDPIVKAAPDVGVAVDPDFTMDRVAPDGVHLHWRVGMISGHDFAGLMPHFIDWMGSPHPSDNTPSGCVLQSFQIETPRADALHKIYDRLGVGVPVVTGDGDALEVVLDTPKGTVTLRSGRALS